MALSGNVKSNRYSSGTPRGIELNWTASQDIAGNYSTISWTLKGENDSYTSWVMSGGFKVVIDGDTVYSTSTDSRIQLKNTTVVKTGTKKINHNSDGTKSFSIYIEAGVYSYAVSVSGSKSFTLDTIPRASTFTATNANVGSKSTVTITKASSAFVHRVWYRTSGINNGNWVEPELNKVIEGTSYSFTIPTSFYNAMSTVKTKSVEVYLATYTSKANATAGTYGNEIGHKTVNITVTVPQDASLPASAVTFTAVNTDTSKTGSASKVISGYNSVKATISATAKNGASIKSYKIENGSNSQSLSTFTFDKVTNGTFKATVTDSRGYVVTKTVTLEVIAYFKPTIKVSAKIGTNGRMDATIKGTAFNGSINSTTNSRRVYWRVGRGSWTEITANTTFSTTNFSVSPYVTGLDYRTTYTVQAKIVDSVQTVESKAVTVSCLPIFDWSKSDFNFNVPVYFQSVADGDVFVSKNERGFYGKDTDGNNKKLLYLNSNNSCIINPSGSGTDGTTNIYGGNGASPRVNVGSSSAKCDFYHNSVKMTYDVGDTITLNQNTDCFAGFVTSSTALFFTIPINRPICAASVSVSGNIQGRGVNGYINGTNYGNSYFDINTVSGHHTTTYEIKPTGISVRIEFSAAIANATNNTPVTMTPQGNLTITFK